MRITLLDFLRWYLAVYNRQGPGPTEQHPLSIYQDRFNSEHLSLLVETLLFFS
jgi:hypothetical protein